MSFGAPEDLYWKSRRMAPADQNGGHEMHGLIEMKLARTNYNERVRSGRVRRRKARSWV